jgi:phage-related minor tail protein
MASQNIARLGIVLGMDSGELVTKITEAQQKFGQFKAQIKRDSEDAAKEIVRLEMATRNYGKTLTEVEKIEEQIRLGKYKHQPEVIISNLMKQAAAYDKVAAAAKLAQEAQMGPKGGLTAQQSAALGYQTTDIVTSLLGGQNPMMVLIQQGGQLRDQFGGFKPLFAGIAQALTPLRLAVGGVGAAVLGFGYAMYQGYEESKKFNNSLILTGNIAGMTREKFDALANTVSQKYNYSIFETRDAIQALVSSGRVAADVISPAAEAIAKLSKLSGESADVIAKDLIPMLDGTAGSAKALNERYHFLTFEQYKHIEALERSNQKQKAAVETIDLLNKSLNSQKEKVGIIEEYWDKATNALKGYIQSMKDLGKEESDDKILERLKNRMGILAKSDLSVKVNADAYESVREAYVLMQRKIEAANEQARKKADAQRKEDEKSELYDKIGGAQKFIDLKKQLEDAAAEEEYQRRAYGLQKIDQLEFQAVQEKKKFALEQVRLMEQEHYMTTSERIDLIAQKTKAIDAKLARDKEDLYRQSRLKFEEQARAEQDSIIAERQRLDLYKENLIASQQDLDILNSKLKTNEQLLSLSRQENMSAADRAMANARIYDLEKQREAVIMQREELKKLQDMNASVFNNMGNAIDNFVRTGKLSFRDLTVSIIQDLLSIAMKAQMMSMFRGFELFKNPYTRVGGVVGPDNIDVGGGFNPAGRAVGGPVSGNTPYIVGEQGPELFVPSGSGTIIPNGQLGSSMTSSSPTVIYNGPYIANMSAIDTQSATQFLAKNKQTIWAVNQSAQRSLPVSK